MENKRKSKNILILIEAYIKFIIGLLIGIIISLGILIGK